MLQPYIIKSRFQIVENPWYNIYNAVIIVYFYPFYNRSHGNRKVRHIIPLNTSHLWYNNCKAALMPHFVSFSNDASGPRIISKFFVTIEKYLVIIYILFAHVTHSPGISFRIITNYLRSFLCLVLRARRSR